jgi:hypothetical protein
MTPNEDSINRVVEADLGSGEVVEVPCRTLDQIIGSGPFPQIMKMDIEGFELPALRGATRMLSNPELRACIVEVWSGSKADQPATQLVLALLASFGFTTATYDGFTRVLRATDGLGQGSNTLSRTRLGLDSKSVASWRGVLSVGSPDLTATSAAITTRQV